MKKLFVVFASVALIAAFAVSAPAADWSFYGNARMATFMVDQDYGDATYNPLNQSATGSAAPTTTNDDDDDLQWDLQGNSRVGASVKGDNLSARFEYGTGVNLRRLYGEYDFGGFKLKIGQDYTPVTEFISGQAFDVDLGLIGTGNFYGGRAAQIAVNFPFGAAGLDVAFITPTGTGTYGMTSGDTDEDLPRIEAKFKYSGDAFSFHVFGGYQSFEIEAPTVALVPTSAGKDQDVDSTVIGAGGTLNLGPLTLGAQFSQGENIGVPWFNYGSGTSAAYSPGAPLAFGNYGSGDPNIIAGKIYDVDTLQWMVNGIWKVSDTFSLEAGVGFKEDDLDIPASVFGTSVGEDDQMVYYVQALIEIAPGVTLQPEVGKFDWKDAPVSIDGSGKGVKDEGDVTYYGVKWQINF